MFAAQSISSINVVKNGLSAHSSSYLKSNYARILIKKTKTAPRPHSSSLSLKILNIGWDPEGVLGPPVEGHIQRRKMNKSLEEKEKELKMQKIIAEEQLNQRRIAREARTLPTNHEEMLNFFLETDKQEMVYEIARLRQKIDEDFLSFLKSKIFSFSLSLSSSSKDAEERKSKLESLQKELLTGIEEYDAMSSDMINSKDSLMLILSSKDKKSTILDLASKGKIDLPLLGLLDQNISAAQKLGEREKAEFMSKIRNALLKYITIY